MLATLAIAESDYADNISLDSDLSTKGRVTFHRCAVGAELQMSTWTSQHVPDPDVNERSTWFSCRPFFVVTL